MKSYRASEARLPFPEVYTFLLLRHPKSKPFSALCTKGPEPAAFLPTTKGFTYENMRQMFTSAFKLMRSHADVDFPTPPQSRVRLVVHVERLGLSRPSLRLVKARRIAVPIELVSMPEATTTSQASIKCLLLFSPGQVLSLPRLTQTRCAFSCESKNRLLSHASPLTACGLDRRCRPVRDHETWLNVQLLHSCSNHKAVLHEFHLDKSYISSIHHPDQSIHDVDLDIYTSPLKEARSSWPCVGLRATTEGFERKAAELESSSPQLRNFDAL
jgi:hypothetical protein